MAEYIITDDGEVIKTVVWDEKGLDCWCKWGSMLDVVSFTHDEAKKLAAFIMAQVKNGAEE